MNREKDEHFLINRYIELANMAYDRNIHTCTDFLNMNEIDTFNSIKGKLPPVNIEFAGGNNYAERKIIIFAPLEAYYEFKVPIVVLKIAPANPQYADVLTHRDFLGAILNLGIVRSKIGDIFIKNNIAYVYCLEDIAKFISDNLTKIKHTIVKTDITDYKDISITPDFKEIMGTIANVRLDSLIATAFGSSRNSIIPLIESGKVFINSKMTTNNGASIKDGDIISVRGKGRFIFDGVIKTTKKGRNLIKIRLYS